MTSQLNINAIDNSLIVSIPDEFDGYAVDKYRDTLHELVDTSCQQICLDFKNTLFIDSSGIGVIVFLFKRLRQESKQLHLIDVAGQPLKLMSMLHVDRTISVNPVNLSAAL